MHVYPHAIACFVHIHIKATPMCTPTYPLPVGNSHTHTPINFALDAMNIINVNEPLAVL